jgi:lysophospholipase L1-like esterase
MNISINPKTGIIAISFFIMLLSLILLIHSPGVLAQDLNNTSFDSNDLLHIENDEKSLTTKFEVIGSDPEVVFHKPKQEEEPKLSNQSFEVEANITVLNVQSYPTVGGNWTVEFKTVGCANLTITAVNGTTWNDTNRDNDLELLEIKCGNQILDYTWINNYVFIENYSCNETGYEISKALTAGNHHLKFQFGSDIEHAHNWATDLSNWIYRQSFTISNTAKNLSYYQVKIELNSSNTGSNWNWSNNGNDTRFTYCNLSGETETEIPFWIESWNSTANTSTIWVNVTSVANNTDTTIYMYYGNSNASSASNGTNTFELFDDFESYSIGTIHGQGGWAILRTGGVSGYAQVQTKNGRKHLVTNSASEGTHIARALTSIDNHMSLETYAYAENCGESYFADFGDGTCNSDGLLNAGYEFIWFGWSNTQSRIREWPPVVVLASTYDSGTADQYYRSSFVWDGSNLRAYRDDVLKLSGIDSTYSSLSHIHLGSWSGAIWATDWVFVRKYASPEPGVSLGGTVISNYTPPDPTNLANTTGNNWVNYTWTADAGNITDSYNVSQNGTWDNTSSNTYRNDTISAGSYSDIIIYAYNNTNGLSSGYLSDNVSVSAIAVINSFTPNATLEIQDEQGASYKQSYPYLQKSRTLNTSSTLSSTDGVGGVRFIVDQGETGETIVNDINTSDTFFSAQFFGLSYGNHTLDIIILNTNLVPLSGPGQTESIDPFWIVPYIIQFVGDSITISLADDTTCDVLNLADATDGCNAVTSENSLELPCWDNDAVVSKRDYSNGIHIFYSDYAKSIYGTYVFGNNEAESGITAGGTHTKFQNNTNGYADRFASLDENGSNAGLFGPTHVYVMLGLNDKRTGVTEDTYETQLSNVVNDTHNKGIPYENITLLYPTYWQTYDVSNYLDNIDNVANNLGTRLIKDLYNETKDNYDNGGESWYCAEDNVHFSRAGSRIISRIIVEQSTWLITEQANYTEYSGSETTDFNNISDITNVSDATLQTNTAKITWYNNVNASEANFDINVDFGFAFVNVNSTGLNSTFNSSANVTFYNLSWSKTPVIFEDGSPSQDCAINFYSGGNLSFNVTHFTNYSAGANANLTIWDDTDPEGGSQTKYSRDKIKFYANYTNRTSGQPINETGVYCNISFNVTPNGPFGMTFNSSSLLYEYNRSFPTSGTFNWNVTGNGSVQDYEELDVTDIVTVIISTSNSYIPPDPTNLANTTGNFRVNHTWSAGSGNVTNSYNVSVNGVWHNATADNFWNDTYTAHAWQNITIYTYNTSGNGTLSSGNISQDAQIPNNPVTITNTSGWSGDAGANVYVDYDATDADSDIPTFSCNRTDLFADFHTSTGTGNWTAASGTHVVDFGVSDGYGSTDNYTMTITVATSSIVYIPPDPTNLANTTGNNWVNYTWTADAGNITDSYNVSQNGTWDNTSSNTYRNDTISAGSYSDIIIYAYNNTNGLSSGYLSDNVSVSAIAVINSFTPNATLEIQDEQGASYKQSYPYLQKSRTLNTSSTLSSTDGVGGVRFIVDQGETGETIVNDINTSDTFFSAQFFGLSYGNHTLDIIILNTNLVPLSGPGQTESIDPFWIVPYIIQFVGDSITISLADDTTCDVLNLADATDGCNAVTSENSLELPCWDNDAVVSKRDYSNGIHIFYSDYAKSIYGTYVFGNNEAESGITAGGTHTKFQNNTNGYADRFASLDENGSNAGLFGPTHVYVMLGLNDKRTGVTEDTYETQLSNVVNDTHNKGIPYENITLLYPTYWQTYDVSNYLDNIDNVANNLGTRLIKDLYNETKDNYDNGGESWYCAEDNVHFSRAGSRIISRIIVEQSTWLITEQANYTEYSGSETTDFNNISDITNVSDATLQTNTAKITWYNNVNASEANFDINVDFGFAFVNVNSTGLNSTFNSSANVTFYNLSWSKTPVIFEDGSPSQDCAINFYSGGNLSFNVTHFTNYSAGANANLTIWDDTDPEGGSQTKYSRDKIKFYANYTNRTSGQPINETGVYCNISFNVTPNGPFGMTFNSSSLLYEYNRSFPTSGTFNWNVTGNGSVQDYEELDVTDIVTVIISTSNSYIPPDPTNLANTTGNFRVNHTWSAGSGNVTNSYNVSVNGVWHNATADNFWNDTYTAHAWQNITVYAYNTSGTGTLSTGCVSDEVQAPEVLSCTCGDICVNTSGWWRHGGGLNGSDMPIQAAVDNASSGKTIYVYNGTYSENIDVSKQLTLTGEGTDVVNVTSSTADSHVFNVSANYVNISGFNVTGVTGNMKAGIYISNGVDQCNIFGNTVSDNYIGIYLNSSSSNNLFTNNTISDNTWDNYIASSTSAFSNNTLNGTKIDFIYCGDVSLKGVDSPANDPTGQNNIGKFINVTNQSAGAWMFINFSYSDADVSGLDESSLKVWKYNGTAWVEDGWNGSQYLDTINNVVGVNITSFSVFAPMGSSSSSCLNCTVNITPGDLESNSTGIFTAIINCTDPAGINTSRFIMTRTVEDSMYQGGPPNRWSIRPPVNDITQSNGSFVQILRAYNRGKGDWYDFAGLFTDNFSYAVNDINSSHVTITNGSTWAKLNYTWVVEPTVFRNSFFLNRKQLETETKKEYNVYADHPLLVKFLDLEHMRGTADYTVCAFRNINYSGIPNADLKTYYCNSSYRTVSKELPNNGNSDATANMTGNVLLMHLDETGGTIVDYSGEGNNGTMHGEVTYGADGKINTSLSYDGNGDYVSVLNDPSLNISGPITLAAWVNFNSFGSSSPWNGIVTKWCHIDHGGSGWGYGLFKRKDTNKIAFITASEIGGGYADAQADAPPALNTWYHVVGTYDGSIMYLYINGVLQLQDTDRSQSAIYRTSNPVTIGTFETVNDFWLDGEIDEVAIWNRSLSGDEVLDLYQRGVRKPSKDTDNCVGLNTFGTTDLDDIYYTSRNSSYSKSCFGVNNSKFGGIDTTDTFYIAYESETTAGNYYSVRYANGSSGTNVSFADSNVAWTSANDAVNWTQAQFTPDLWFSTIKQGDQFQLGVYVENNTGGNYTNFKLYTDDIGDVNYPISNPGIAYYENAIGTKDYDLNDSYFGDMTINIIISKDPDAPGTVNHSLYLYNPDGTFNTTINSSFYSPDDSNVNVIFDTSTVSDGKYRMNVTAVVDDNSSDVESYLTTVNFTVDNTVPGIQLNYPDDKADLSSSTVNFNWTATDNLDGELSCDLTIDGVTDHSSIASISGQPTTCSVSGISNVPHNWYVTCRDDAGNAVTSETRTFGTNNSAPDVTLNSPPNGSITSNHRVILNATVTDANDDDMTVYFYANDNINGLNASCGLVHIEENVADGSTITYNLTTLPIKPSEEGLLMLMHFDNRSGFGENSTHVYDFSGNSNNGTVNGTPDYNISGGKFAGAYVFDGTDDYVEAPAIPQISGSNSRTVEFWFKTTNNSGNQPIFDGGTTGQNDTAFEFFTTAQDQIGGSPPKNTPGLYCGFWDNDVYLPDINYYDGNWHHVALTLYGNNTTELYYDGTKPRGYVWNGTVWTSLTSQPFSLPGNPNTPGDQPFLIGTSRDDCRDHGSMHFNGIIDEVAIYNRNLSADEILNHYRLAEGNYYWKVNATDGILSNELEVWNFYLCYKPDLRVINVTFNHCDTSENISSISETGTGWHVKENRNITINATIANYADINVTSNFNVSFFDSAGVYGNWSRCFWNFTYNVSTEGELGSVTTGYPHNTTYVTGYWNPSLVGTHNISVWANPANSASESAKNTTNNNASAVINVSAWQKYYGNVSGGIALADSASNLLYNWTWSNKTDVGYAYIVNAGASINWSALHALGCDSDNTLNASGQDFLDADTNLGMVVGSNNATGFLNNNITELFSSGDPGNATNTTSFTVYGTGIPNVPIINSIMMTNHTSIETANFVTGILWDATSDKNGYYDTTDDETLVFVTKITVAAKGFGSNEHNYEFAAPCTLNPVVGGDMDIYMELK